eukprot:c16353_g1_i1.p1 GENE.c16353_g1_i1~~c16353_g1_i1.p1  ORF type:complete len:121 (+),score=14.63 c16353_g1_i1:49-363(+)
MHNKAVLVLVLLVLLNCVEAKKKSKQTRSKEYRASEGGCRGKCTGLQISAGFMDPCIYKCMDSDCYAKIFGEKELEEGEVDVQRSKEFAACFAAAKRMSATTNS